MYLFASNIYDAAITHVLRRLIYLSDIDVSEIDAVRQIITMMLFEYKRCSSLYF